jgi:hypothetical protein
MSDVREQNPMLKGLPEGWVVKELISTCTTPGGASVKLHVAAPNWLTLPAIALTHADSDSFWSCWAAQFKEHWLLSCEIRAWGPPPDGADSEQGWHDLFAVALKQWR